MLGGVARAYARRYAVPVSQQSTVLHISGPLASSCLRGFLLSHLGRRFINSVTDRETVSLLRNSRNGADVFLVGTSHISSKSAMEVKEVIELVKPSTIMVELDPKRARGLLANTQKRHGLVDKLGLLLSKGPLSGKLAAIAVSSFYSMLRDSGLEPGQEFKVALMEAKRCNAKIVLGDRDGEETMRRLGRAFSMHEIFGMMAKSPEDLPPGLLEKCEPILRNWKEGFGPGFGAAMEKMKTRENARLLHQFMESVAPKVAKVMIHERDEYMVGQLKACEGIVVGVVGLAHMDGIERLWHDG